MQRIYTAVYRPGVTHPKIDELNQQAVQLRNQLAILSADRRQLLGELVQEAFPDQKINPHTIIEGHWPCPDPEGDGRSAPTSPTGKCLYVIGGIGSNPSNDENCLYCGLPLERK